MNSKKNSNQQLNLKEDGKLKNGDVQYKPIY